MIDNRQRTGRVRTFANHFQVILIEQTRTYGRVLLSLWVQQVIDMRVQSTGSMPT